MMPLTDPILLFVLWCRDRPFATGNWGCGAFGGDPELKSLMQWVAASYWGRYGLCWAIYNSMAKHPYVT